MADLRQAAQQVLDVLDGVCNERRICIVLHDRADDAIPASCPAVKRLWVAKHNLSDALAAPQPQPLSDTDIFQGWKSATKLVGVPTDQVVLTFGRWLEAMHGIEGDK